MKGANSSPFSEPAFDSRTGGVFQTSIKRPRPTAKWRPDGEKAKAVTVPWKEKWCKVIRRGKLVSIARPSSSTESRRFPRGVRAMRDIFLWWENGRVYDLLLEMLATGYRASG
jgi:hypothetical protein